MRFVYSILFIIILYYSQLKYTLKGFKPFYLARGLKPEPLHVEQGNSRSAHKCNFHCLHRQGNTFLLKAYSRVCKILVLRSAAIHSVHTLLSHD